VRGPNPFWGFLALVAIALVLGGCTALEKATHATFDGAWGAAEVVLKDRMPGISPAVLEGAKAVADGALEEAVDYVETGTVKQCDSALDWLADQTGVRIEQYDQNHDGLISATELSAYIRAFSEESDRRRREEVAPIKWWAWVAGIGAGPPLYMLRESAKKAIAAGGE